MESPDKRRFETINRTILPGTGGVRPRLGIAPVRGVPDTPPLRGLQDSPPYLHDRRLLTIAGTVEFFNLVTGVKLTKQEKADPVAFLRCL